MQYLQTTLVIFNPNLQFLGFDVDEIIACSTVFSATLARIPRVIKPLDESTALTVASCITMFSLTRPGALL